MHILATAEQSFEPIPEGIYEFFVVESRRSYTMKKDLIFKLELSTEYNGVDRRVYDNIVFIEKCAFKITSYARALGYNVKEGNPVDEEVVGSSRGKKVRAKVVIEDDPKYGKRNRIARYIKSEAVVIKGANTSVHLVDDEPGEIPY